MRMAGKDGTVSIGAVKIGYIDDFNLNINSGTSESSQKGGEWKEFLETARDWSGSMSGSMDYADASQKKIVDALILGKPIDDPTLVFVITKELSVTGKVIFTSISISSPHADKVAVSFNFQGNGALASAEVI